MAIRHLHRLIRLLGFTAVATWVGAGCTSYPSPPADPVYETDVRPIFLAHCARCHGAGPDGGARRTAAGNQDTGSLPPVACFTQYGANPDASPDGGCTEGANSEPGKIEMYIHSTVAGVQMPPPPAAPLNSYELGVLDNWLHENPPLKCSDSPNPDPALHCISGSYP